MEFMEKIFISGILFFIAAVFISCGGDDGAEVYETDKSECNGKSVDYETVCDIGDVKNCSQVGDYDDLEWYAAVCKEDCSGWDTSECSKCGDGVITGIEECDGNESPCESILGDYFESGTAYCNSNCMGWLISECKYKRCPDGGIPSDDWKNNETGDMICVCSPNCKSNTECDRGNKEICSSNRKDLYGNWVSYCVYDNEVNVGMAGAAYLCPEEQVFSF
jgi:hypothetical protein